MRPTPNHDDRAERSVGVTTETVAADDLERVARLIERHGIGLIVNVAGPYSETQMPVLRAAVRAGVHYLDVVDGARETREALKVDGEAKAAGSVCVLGAGMFPGLTNILAMRSASRLDIPSSVAVAITISVQAAVPDSRAIALMKETGDVGAGWIAMMEAASRPSQIHQAGAAFSERPGTTNDLTTPSGRTVALALHDHSEPMTLPQHLPTITDAVTYRGFVPEDAESLFRAAAMSVTAGEHTAPDAVMTFFERVNERRDDLAPARDTPVAEVWAEVEGMKDGHPVRVTSWANGLIPTSTVLAASVNGIAEGRLDTAGVRTAETLSSDTFLSLLADEADIPVSALVGHRITELT
ncbi:MAG: saccharopine dehydrogenase family protein [Acidimicrobiia bacterium]